MKMKVGNYEVLENGSIICVRDYPVEFVIGGLTYKVMLHKDLNTSEYGNNVEILLNSDNINSAEIHLYLKDSIALASNIPYTVGDYNGRALCFAFRVDNFSSMMPSDIPAVLNYAWLHKNSEVVFKPTKLKRE